MTHLCSCHICDPWRQGTVTQCLAHVLCLLNQLCPYSWSLFLRRPQPYSLGDVSMLNSPNFLQPPLFLRRAVEDTDCQPWLCFRVNRGLKILTLTLRESDLFDLTYLIRIFKNFSMILTYRLVWKPQEAGLYRLTLSPSVSSQHCRQTPSNHCPPVLEKRLLSWAWN